MNRFLQDFRDVCVHHGLEEGAVFEYPQMENFCRDLGLYDDKPSSKQLLAEIWSHLHTKDNEESEENTSDTVRVEELKVFLSAVLNFNQPWMKAPPQEEDEEQEPRRVNPKRLGEV